MSDEITTEEFRQQAARSGGGDIDANPRLRSAVAAAKTENMPKDNIERAIKKGTGELEGVSYEESAYEGYGPGGAAILVESLTDNKNRAVADIRHIFNKYGGNMGENGCVAWMFDKKGYFNVDKAAVDEEKHRRRLQRGVSVDVERQPFGIDAGRARIPEGPGWGVEPAATWLDRARVQVSAV